MRKIGFVFIKIQFYLKTYIGVKNENRLSKRPDWKVRVKNDNKNQKLIKKNKFKN